ncbi:hypothetical protein GCM10029992_58650 [Glycomyces albus]
MIIVVVTQPKSMPAVEMSVDVGRWRTDLDALWARTAPAFRRIETRRNAKRLTVAMMAHLERRNCWTLAEHAGEAGPWRFQHLLSRASWDDDRVRSEIRAWASERLSTAEGLRGLAVDETGDIKKGARTVGVQRQYSGTAGRIENCQLAVYLALATAAGHAAVDVRLYMPKSWTDDFGRCAAAGVPEQVSFATKPELAGDMIEAALDAGIGADFAVGDEAYGIDPELRRGCGAGDWPMSSRCRPRPRSRLQRAGPPRPGRSSRQVSPGRRARPGTARRDRAPTTGPGST